MPQVFICGDPLPDGTLTCPRCGRPTVFRSFPYGEPKCDAKGCRWTAGRGRPAWKEPA